MKYIKTFESFVNGNKSDKIDIMQDNELDLLGRTLTIYYDPESGWDRKSDYLRDLKNLANNENDPMSTDIDDALEYHGLMIDTTKKHKFDVDNDTIEIFLTKKNKK